MAFSMGTISFGISMSRKGLAVGMNALKKGLEATGQAAKVTGNWFDTLDTSMGKTTQTVGQLASAIGAITLTKLAKDATLLAGRVENLGTVLENVGHIAGNSQAQVALFEERVKSMGITTRHARQSMALMGQSQIDLAHSAKLARIAQDAAVIAGINSSEAYNRLTVGIQRTNTWILRNLGLLINLRQVFQRFALETGRTTDTLSGLEKQQLLLNEVMKKGLNIAGTYESAMEDVYKQYTSLARHTEEAARVFGEQFMPIFSVVVTTLTDSAKAWKNLPSDVHAATASYVAATGAVIAFTAATVAWLKVIKPLLVTIGKLHIGLRIAAFGIFAIAQALTFHSAQARNAALAMEEYRKGIAKQVEVTNQLRKLYQQIVLLGSKTDRTSEQTKKLNAAMTEATYLMKGYREQLSAAHGDAARFAQIMAQANKEITISTEESLERHIEELRVLRRERKELLEASEEYRREQDKLGPYTPLQRDFFAEAARRRREQNEIADIDRNITKRELQTLEERRAISHETFQVLRERAKEMEIGYQLALKKLQEYQSARRKAWKDTHLNIWWNYRQYMQEMRAESMSPEEIEKFLELEHERERDKIMAQFVKTTKDITDKSTKEYKDAQVAMQDSLNLLAERMREKELDLYKQADAKLDALKKGTEIFERQLKDTQEANVRLRKTVVGIQAGMDPALLRSVLDAERFRVETSKTRQRFLADEKILLKEIAKISGEIDLIGDPDEYRRQIAEIDKERAAHIARVQQDIEETGATTEEEIIENTRKYMAAQNYLAEQRLATDRKLRRALKGELSRADAKDQLDKKDQLDARLKQLKVFYQHWATQEERTQLQNTKIATEQAEIKKKIIQDTAEFITEAESRARRLSAPYSDFVRNFTEFVDAVRQANVSQLKELLTLWPDIAAESFRELNEELEQSTLRFDDLYYSQFKERFGDPERLAREYSDLLKMGVPAHVARREVDAWMMRREAARRLEIESARRNIQQLHLTGQQMELFSRRVGNSKTLLAHSFQRIRNMITTNSLSTTALTLSQERLRTESGISNEIRNQAEALERANAAARGQVPGGGAPVSGGMTSGVTVIPREAREHFVLPNSPSRAADSLNQQQEVLRGFFDELAPQFEVLNDKVRWNNSLIMAVQGSIKESENRTEEAFSGTGGEF